MKKIIQMALPILLAILLLTACQSNTTDANSDVIKMPSNYAKYEGKNYLDVYKSLKELGFYDIEFEVIEDLITGWLVADGEVESVSIDGDDSFRRGDVFDKNLINYQVSKSPGSTFSNKIYDFVLDFINKTERNVNVVLLQLPNINNFPGLDRFVEIMKSV